MAGFLDHLMAEIQALEQSLAGDPRFVKLRELQRVRSLYESQPGVLSPDSPSLKGAGEPGQRRQPTPRTMTPETRAIVNAATEYVRNRLTPVPLRELYHEIAEVRGIPIGGKNPINNLSAMLWRYGFRAEGRAGWRLQETKESADQSDSGDGEPQKETLFSAPRINGAAGEKHGAATF
jgi:hypothetical protein